MKKPFLIILDGPMGAGKSTVAVLLQNKIKENTALISLDKLKKMVSNYELDSHYHLSLAADMGATMTNLYLKKGVNVIVEKAFTTEEFLKSFIKSIKSKSNIFVYQIEVPLEIGFARVKEREEKKEKRGIHKSKLKEKVTRNHMNYNQFKYKKAKIFDSSKISAEGIAKSIFNEVSKK